MSQGRAKYPRLICWDRAACQQADRFLSSCVLIANDIETFPFKKKNKMPVFSLTVNGYTGIDRRGVIKSYAFPFQNSKHPASGAPINIETIYDTCYRINNYGIPFCYHNGTYDCSWLIRYGLAPSNYYFDSMSGWWSIYPDLPKSLDFVSSILRDDYQFWKSGRKEDDFEEYMHYAMSDTESTLLNSMSLINYLITDDKSRLNFVRAHSRTLSCLGLTMRGLDVDTDRMKKFEVELKEKAEDALAKVRYLVADDNFNPQSPKQKVELLYGILGAKKRNAKGRFVARIEEASSGANAMRAMRSDHPLIRRVVNGVLNAIEPAKQLSNVVGLVMLPKTRENVTKYRFTCTYAAVGTTTTRLSSSSHPFGHGGNAQNIRKDYRNFARADPDTLLLEVDFASSDDCYIAFESGEQKKIDLIRSGKDVHATNASMIYFTNWSYEDIVKGKEDDDPKVIHPITGIRQITKKLVHGGHYLMAGNTLLMTAQREAIVAAALELGHNEAGKWDQKKLADFCTRMDDKFRDYYRRFQRSGPDSWYTDIQDELRTTGGVTTIFNYYQRFLADWKEDSTLRAAAATKGQANTAGRVNMAMEELDFGIRTLLFRDGPAPDSDDKPRPISYELNGADLRAQTHDSLMSAVYYKHARWRDGVDNLLRVLQRPVVCKGQTFVVGIEAEVAYRWAEKVKSKKRRIYTVDDVERFIHEVER